MRLYCPAMPCPGFEALALPGLQKKVERGQPLPPGWQKKLNDQKVDHFDRDLLRFGNIRDVDGNRQRVEIEGRVYTIIKDTREIIDILNQ